MTTITSTTAAVQSPFDDSGFDEARLAAASFLARYYVVVAFVAGG